MRWLLLAFLALAPLAPAQEEPFMRGMTVSCQTYGIEWGRPEFGQTLDRLKALGVTWVAIHPYAQVQEEGGVRWRPMEEQTHLVRALAMAKERGIKMLVIPHLAYWGTKFKWRGAIWFPPGEAWDRFFHQYEQWIVELARVAEAGGAGMFSIGHEYDHMHYYEKEWRRIIASVRAVYRGKVVYHANWSDYERIPFWDACDYIAIGAYQPLAASDGAPQAEIEAGWREFNRKLGVYARAHGKRVIFTEIGYNRSSEAARKPWEYETGGPQAAEIRRRCVETALKLEGAAFPELAGMFWWKFFADIPGRNHPENFDMREPEMIEAIGRAWGGGGGGK